jgi:hypothetical protein
MLQVLKNKIDDDLEIESPSNFMKELVFNFPRYEPEIKKYGIRHQHISINYFYEFLKSMLLGELKKKYTSNNTNVVATNNNVVSGDKNEFDNLMSTYFNKEEVKQLNNLIDNDTTIVKDIFKKQLINNYSDYKNDIITYTETNDYNVNTFYEFLKQFLMNKMILFQL